MGCASSAALPFLTNRGNESGTPNLNGKPSNELNMVNNKLKGNVAANVKDINDSYVSDKMKEVVDSTAVQGVIGGVIQTKDDVINQVQGFGETITEKVSSAADDVEEKIEATFVKLTNKVGSMEEDKTEVQSMEEDINSVLGGVDKEAREAVKPEEIDELLDELPNEDEVKATAEEVLEKAAQEVRAEAEANN